MRSESALGLAIFIAVGCGPAPASQSPRPQTPTPKPALEVPLPDADWRRVALRAQGLSLSLPDARNWQARGAGSFWLAEHAPTQSQLLVKAWSSETLVDIQDCETEARLLRSDLEHVRSEQVIDQDPGRVVAGARARVTVATRVEPRPAENSVVGVVQTVSAEVRRCLVLEFSTRASGSTASRTIADRLALVSNKLLATLERTSLEQRVGVEPRQQTP